MKKVVLFNDDDELSDDEIRKLLKRGLKKKKELDVNVAQEFFGLEKESAQPPQDQETPLNSVDVAKSSEKKEPSPLARKTEKTRSKSVSVATKTSKNEREEFQKTSGTLDSLQLSSAAPLGNEEDFDTFEAEGSLEESSRESLDVQARRLEKSITQLEELEEQVVGAPSSEDSLEGDIFQAPPSKSVKDAATIGTEGESAAVIEQASVTGNDELRENLDVSATKATSLPSSIEREIRELQVLVRTLYELLDSVIVQLSMLSGDKEGLPAVISKILVELGDWNDIEQYPEASTIYTALSRLRSRIKKLPEQSLISGIVQEELDKRLQGLRESKLESTSAATLSALSEDSKSTFPSPSGRMEASEEPSRQQSVSIAETSVLDEEIQIGQFHRATRAKDYWSYIVSSGQLMESYQHISDVIIPLYWRYALIEIHRYRIDDPVLLRHVIKIPAEALNDIIRKLLREAPTSRLLQRVKQKRLTDQLLSEFLPNELKDRSLFIKIRESVERYLEYFTNVQKGILSFEDVKVLGEQSLKSFELGPNEIETRIPLVALNVLRELKERIPSDEELGDRSLNNEKFLEAVCGYLTIYLVNELNRHFINESKFYTLLERLKQS